MKFLCEHCKAKYQIADEKVAGRTVRMKCRKCGHQIEVRAAVTETSVSSHLPRDPAEFAGAGPATERGASLGSAPPGKPAKPPPPRQRPMATSLSNARPAAPGRPATNMPGQHEASGALAGAFQRQVQKEEEISVALDLRELSASDEWYVAINGVPVGPVRVAELRRKAALGVVTDESLIWQEGMEEWRPVRAVSELAAVVREAAAGGRVSLVTPPPPEGRISSPPGPPSPRYGSTRPAPSSSSPSPRAPAAPVRPAAPHGPAPAAARSNVVPITSRLATAEKLDEDATIIEPQPQSSRHEPMVARDPFAMQDPHAPYREVSAQLAALTPRAPAGMGGPTAQPLGQPGSGLGMSGVPSAAGTGPYGPVSAPLPSPLGVYGAPLVVPQAPARPVPWIIVAMLVLAGAFGVTAALVVFRPAAAPVAQAPATASSPLPPAPAGSSEPAAQVAPTDSASPVASTAGPVAAARGGGGRSSGGGARATSQPGAPADPDLQKLIAGSGSGPSTGPGSGGGGGGGGATLSSAQVQNVVQNQSVGIRRTCWERSSSQAASANVNVRIEVAASGAVTGASADGSDPVIAKCIENGVRNWRFPPSDGPSTINVPFHFVRQ